MKSVRRHPKVRKNTLTAQKYQNTSTDKDTKGEECIEEYRELFDIRKSILLVIIIVLLILSFY